MPCYCLELTGANRNTIKDHIKAPTRAGHLVQHGAGRGTWYGFEKMVGHVGLEPSTIGLKVRNGVIKWHTIQPLTGTPVATFARLCTTVHN